MPGQGIVAIRDKRWSVTIANTPWELMQGLGGLSELPRGTGMLFDVGWGQPISVSTETMLFNLDIAFLSESLVVIDLVQHFLPGHRITSVRPARYFLEVNAGEMDNIDLGDQAYVELLSLQEAPIMPDWMTMVFSFMGFALMGAFAVDTVKTLMGTKTREHALGSSSSEHHSPWLTLEQRKSLQEKYGAVAVRWAEEAARPSDMKGVEAAAEYYYGKLKEVFGLGHFSPELSEKQIRKLRELLGLTADVAEILRTHRRTGYIP